MIGGRVILVCGGFCGDFVGLGGLGVATTGGGVIAGGLWGACVVAGAEGVCVVVGVLGLVTDVWLAATAVVVGIGVTAPAGVIERCGASKGADTTTVMAAVTMAPTATPASIGPCQGSRERS
jgi:hypothetical protein